MNEDERKQLEQNLLALYHIIKLDPLYNPFVPNGMGSGFNPIVSNMRTLFFRDLKNSVINHGNQLHFVDTGKFPIDGRVTFFLHSDNPDSSRSWLIKLEEPPEWVGEYGGREQEMRSYTFSTLKGSTKEKQLALLFQTVQGIEEDFETASRYYKGYELGSEGPKPRGCYILNLHLTAPGVTERLQARLAELDQSKIKTCAELYMEEARRRTWGYAFSLKHLSEDAELSIPEKIELLDELSEALGLGKPLIPGRARPDISRTIASS